MSADSNGKMPGGITGKGFKPGQTGNPNGQPKWVSEARNELRGGLWGLARRHLEWVLSGQPPRDAKQSELAMYEGATLEDRNAATRLVMEYSIPKPKAQVGLKHSGEGGQPLSISINLEPEEKP
jgi:hypothetical protein